LTITVIGEGGPGRHFFEYKNRRSGAKELLPLVAAAAILKD
jgi:hypothetical protein